VGQGLAPAIRTKGIRDYAYLAIKRHGKPMHFSEVAKTIGTMFSKKAHVATTHNELIKDPRFVLVGRGLYALAEWGYKPGVVRDVIREVLAEQGPLKKDEVIKQVKKARFVKDNTILVNLNDSRYFKRTQGRPLRGGPARKPRPPRTHPARCVCVFGAHDACAN
jgi:hypothetical protein